jgi:uncharacterized membrane protein YqaE (UPF0057 family)
LFLCLKAGIRLLLATFALQHHGNSYISGASSQIKLNKQLMKKQQLALAAALLVATSTLLSSCSSNSGLAIEKRKYRGGYHVTWNGGQSTPKTEKTEIAVTSTPEVITPAATLTAAPVQISAEITPVLAERTTAYPAPVITETQETSVSISSYSAPKLATGISAEMTKSELKQFRKEIKKSMKQETRSFAGDSGLPEWALAILCIILPPLAVGLELGVGTDFWINILLTLLFWIPGVIHAFVVIF